MSRGANELVEIRRDLRVCVQVVPERPPEDLLVGGNARSRVLKQTAQGVRHPAANAIKAENKLKHRIEQATGGFIQHKPARLRLLKNALAHQVLQNPMQDIAVTVRRLAKLLNPFLAVADVLGDPKCRRYVDTPWSTKIAERPNIGVRWVCCSAWHGIKRRNRKVGFTERSRTSGAQPQRSRF